eukprot:scaffold302_cov397-Prasinococcus_capsulatus_cf.AAC.8
MPDDEPQGHPEGLWLASVPWGRLLRLIDLPLLCTGNGLLSTEPPAGEPVESDLAAMSLESRDPPLMPEPEAAAVYEWRKRREEELRIQEAEEVEKRRELASAGEEALSSFYAQRAKQMEERRKTNREKQAVASTNYQGKGWEGVVELIDATYEQKTDLARFKGLLVKLKHTGAVAAG